MSPPPKPWIQGNQPQYTAFRLTVDVCQDSIGNVWSEHHFSSPEDEKSALSLPQGGIPQVAHALLSEAVLREVFMVSLLKMSTEPEFLDQWARSTPEEQTRMEGLLAGSCHHVMEQTIRKMLPTAVPGVLRMLQKQSIAIE